MEEMVRKIVTTSMTELTNTTSVVATRRETSSSSQITTTISRDYVNGTGFFIDEDVNPGLNDVETFFVSCVITIVPLFVTMLIAVSIRIGWKQYKNKSKSNTSTGEDFDDFLKEGSSESMSRPLHSALLNAEKEKGDESHVVSIMTADEDVIGDTSNGNAQQSLKTNHSNTNGSIITMTLKNNHLIVEKEERNDLEEDSRETIVKYSPDARDGIFVVEVQQGCKRSPSTSDRQTWTNTTDDGTEQCAIVHSPPDKLDILSTGRTVPSSPASTPTLTPLTGLTQSNQSISGDDFRRSYAYTAQRGYDDGGQGYPSYEGYVHYESPKKTPPSERAPHRPKVTSAVYKNRKDTLDFDPMTDGPLLSDVMAKEKVLGMDREGKAFPANMLKTEC